MATPDAAEKAKAVKIKDHAGDAARIKQERLEGIFEIMSPRYLLIPLP